MAHKTRRTTRATGQPIKDTREHLHIVVSTRFGQPGRVDGRGLLHVGAVNHGAPWQTTQNRKTLHTTAPGQNGAPGERLTRYRHAVPTPKQPPRVWLVVTQTQHGAGVSRFPWLRFPPVLGGGCVFWSLVTVSGFPVSVNSGRECFANSPPVPCIQHGKPGRG